MNTHIHKTPIIAGIYALLISTSLAATVDIGWEAEGITDGALLSWATSTDVYAPPAATWTGSGTKASGTSNFANVNDWVNSPDYNFSATSWHDNSGDAVTDADASWELVFRPGSFTGNRHLFNTGGNGDGTAFTIEGSTLHFIFQDANSATQRVDLIFDLSTVGSSNDFFHIVGTADITTASAGTGVLWVNGVQVSSGTSTGTINDWDGGNIASLGSGAEDHNIPSDRSYTSAAFTGDIATFNFYGGEILDAAEVSAAYTSLVPEPSSVLLSLIGFTSLCLRRQRK